MILVSVDTVRTPKVNAEAIAGKAELVPERNSRRDRGWSVAGIVILAMVSTLAIAHTWKLAKTLQYRSFPCDFCSF
jgi:hypothetical protein